MRSSWITVLVTAVASCSEAKMVSPPAPDPSACRGTAASQATPLASPPGTPALSIDAAFTIQAIAKVSGARELAMLPNGDLIVGTNGADIYLVPNVEAESGYSTPVSFATVGDSPAAGVAFDASTCRIYVGTNHGVYAIAYTDGATRGTAAGPIALVRQKDDGGHNTTSVAVSADKLYAGVGSSCNACVESDPTRATVQVMNLDGKGMTTLAKRIRNAIALAVNPATGAVWAGSAGQDGLVLGHPYEVLDPVTVHGAIADYGWPVCEEDHNDYGSGANCAATTSARVVLPPYATPIGAAFYPTTQGGAYAFPAAYRGGLFVSMHGSWHENAGGYYTPPSLAFVPMSGDDPAIAVNWSDPHAQWQELVGNFQSTNGRTRLARPTGIAVGTAGSLFFADDDGGLIFRVRPK